MNLINRIAMIILILLSLDSLATDIGNIRVGVNSNLYDDVGINKISPEEITYNLIDYHRCSIGSLNIDLHILESYLKSRFEYPENFSNFSAILKKQKIKEHIQKFRDYHGAFISCYSGFRKGSPEDNKFKGIFGENSRYAVLYSYKSGTVHHLAVIQNKSFTKEEFEGISNLYSKKWEVQPSRKTYNSVEYNVDNLKCRIERSNQFKSECKSDLTYLPTLLIDYENIYPQYVHELHNIVLEEHKKETSKKIVL